MEGFQDKMRCDALSIFLFFRISADKSQEYIKIKLLNEKKNFETECLFEAIKSKNIIQKH